MKRLKIFKIILLILVGLFFIPWTSIFGIETRTEFMNSLIDQNGLSFFLLFILLLTFFFTNILYGKSKVFLVAILQFVGLFLLGTITTFCFYLPNMWADKMVYKQTKADNYLIIQHFAFGITSSRPEWRVIKTENLKAIIRKVEHIDNSRFPLLNIDNWQYAADSIPQLLAYGGETYLLVYKE
ncbi:MAG: hypothetical protein V4620_02935 [Bacteroidota bacterium]